MPEKTNRSAEKWIPWMGTRLVGENGNVDIVIVDGEGKPFVCRIGRTNGDLHEKGFEAKKEGGP